MLSEEAQPGSDFQYRIPWIYLQLIGDHTKCFRVDKKVLSQVFLGVECSSSSGQSRLIRQGVRHHLLDSTGLLCSPDLPSVGFPSLSLPLFSVSLPAASLDLGISRSFMILCRSASSMRTVKCSVHTSSPT